MTLQVDYGLKRETFKWYSPAYDWRTLAEKTEWCENTFNSKDWHLYIHERRFYFKSQKELTAFLLRWS